MADDSAPNQSLNTQLTSRNKALIIIIVVLVILAILAAAGYFVRQKSDEQISKSSEKNGQASVETENGKVMIKEGEMPKNFPTDVAAYKGAQVITSTEAEDGVSLTLKTADSVEKVTNFYKNGLSKNGWNAIKTNTLEGSSLITAKKGDRELVLTVSTDKEDNKTIILIVVGKPQ